MTVAQLLKKIPRFLFNLKVHYRVHGNLSFEVANLRAGRPRFNSWQGQRYLSFPKRPGQLPVQWEPMTGDSGPKTGILRRNVRIMEISRPSPLSACKITEQFTEFGIGHLHRTLWFTEVVRGTPQSYQANAQTLPSRRLLINLRKLLCIPPCL